MHVNKGLRKVRALLLYRALSPVQLSVLAAIKYYRGSLLNRYKVSLKCYRDLNNTAHVGPQCSHELFATAKRRDKPISLTL